MLLKEMESHFSLINQGFNRIGKRICSKLCKKFFTFPKRLFHEIVLWYRRKDRLGKLQKEEGFC